MSHKLLPVECGGCGWKGRRKPGKVVWCAKCSNAAAFQTTPKSQAAIDSAATKYANALKRLAEK